MDINTDGIEVEREITESRNDIASLQKEIDALDEELQELAQQEKVLEDLINQEKQKTYNENIKKKRQDDWQIPPIVQYSYFDESISKYFTVESPEVMKSKKSATDLNEISSGIMQSYQKIVALKENILYENLYRLNGITAFPLNKIFDPERNYLGIRFDIFSTLHKKYSTIHYVILRLSVPLPIFTKEASTDPLQKTYSVHKSTFYVPENTSKLLQNPDLNTGVENFVEKVRDQLLYEQLINDFKQFVIDLTYTDLGFTDDKPVFPQQSFGDYFQLTNKDIDIRGHITTDCTIHISSITPNPTNLNDIFHTHDFPSIRKHLLEILKQI
ncbi:hypothetical protein CLIB1444_09S04016 [[Candida] jaroonii]|uniref:Uncharacterized protein n=1 Tax=[Candida] jaroonii TaxID=467808 RepID=A0ACA9YBM3_9ASCO|nr:hypothetical protein CLIB1444_09S04016 [[Candida] jaroonii]